MPAPTPRIPAELLEGILRGDEGSLERAFREAYAPLLDEAESALGENNQAAPRVVEKAFVWLWRDRRKLSNPQMADDALHKAIRTGAAREMSRNASLKRLESYEGVRIPARPSAPRPGVAEAWSEVEKLLHPGRAEGPPLGAGTPERRRHVPRIQARTDGRIRVVPMLAGLAIAALAIYAMVAYGGPDRDFLVTQALDAPEARAVNTTIGQFANGTLDDGTKFRLAPASRLKLAKGFGADMRAAALVGTAQFDVPAVEGAPMELRFAGASIFGNGVTFDIRADSGQPAFVRVRDGELTLRVGLQDQVLQAGEAMAIESESRAPTKTEIDEALGWADGRFVVANRPLRDVLPELRRWYSLDLRVSEGGIMDRPVTMNAALDSGRDAVAALERGGSLRFGYVGKEMVLWDARRLR